MRGAFEKIFIKIVTAILIFISCGDADVKLVVSKRILSRKGVGKGQRRSVVWLRDYFIFLPVPFFESSGEVHVAV